MQYNVAQLLKEPTGGVRRYDILEDISAIDPDLDILGPLVGKVQLMRTNSGILVTGTRSGGAIRYNYDAAPTELIERVARIEAIAAAHGVPLPAAALAFVLAHPVVASVIPGVAHPDHVRQTMAWHSTVIPEDFWSELRHEGLIRGDAPVPNQTVLNDGK